MCNIFPLARKGTKHGFGGGEVGVERGEEWDSGVDKCKNAKKEGGVDCVAEKEDVTVNRSFTI